MNSKADAHSTHPGTFISLLASLPCPGMSTTPMMKQYQDAKAACGDAILLFRMGDFYEMFFDDAQTAAKTLGLALTSRDKGENPIPMAGFPHHQLESYLGQARRQRTSRRHLRSNRRPEASQGPRAPGSNADRQRRHADRCLDARSAAEQFSRGHRRRRTCGPGLGRAFHRPLPCRLLSRRTNRRPTGPHRSGRMPVGRGSDMLAATVGRQVVTRRPPGHSAKRAAVQSLSKHFGTANLEGFGFDHESDGPASRRRRGDSRLSH